MASVLEGPLSWHDGENKMHSLLHVPPQDNPTVPALSMNAAFLLRNAPLLALGTLDEEGRPWTSIWGGEVGFAKLISNSEIEVTTPVDAKNDPLVSSLLPRSSSDQAVRTESGGKQLSGLVVDLEKRKRAKLHGRKVFASLTEASRETGIAQLVAHIDASLGNCPKYLNKKHIIPAVPEPQLISDTPQLPPEAISFLGRADTMFVSSSHGTADMDTNIRGGPPGFVRVISNDPSGAVFVYPEYSGNRLYQTLGNLQTTPVAGYVFPDFETGNALYATGRTQILIGRDAAAVLPRSNLAVKVTITAARYVEKALSFRGILGEYSPYNPSVRYLASEKDNPAAPSAEPSITATLIKKEILTPTIGRFRFRVSDLSTIKPWNPGQYATFSFEEELDMGYSHMRDDDPSSLNDDYVRTFTISSHPQALPTGEFEITARRHGNVTGYLMRVNERAGMEVPLKGFGGDFHMDASGKHMLPFIAGGIGITPVLSQLPDLDMRRLRLLWTISLGDLGLVLDTFQRFPQLPSSTTIFATGRDPRNNEEELWKSLSSSGARIVRRRMESGDLDPSLADVWYFCGSSRLKSSVLDWLAGKSVVYEDFNY